MFIAWAEDWKSMYWASEEWMLNVALSRHGVKFHKPESTEEDTLYAFSIDDKRVIYKPTEEKHPSRAIVYTAPNVLQLGGKGVYEKKSSLEKIELSGSNGYSGKLNAELEILNISTDRFGAEFYICFDKDAPREAIRLYRHRDDDHAIGSEILADITNCSFNEPETRDWKACTYSKVIRSTVVELIPAITKQIAVQYHSDPKGNKKPAHDWIQDHGTCSVCTGFCDPAANFRFTTGGESICHECVADPATARLISFAR
jgi:hypothetical protein